MVHACAAAAAAEKCANASIPWASGTALPRSVPVPALKRRRRRLFSGLCGAVVPPPTSWGRPAAAAAGQQLLSHASLQAANTAGISSKANPQAMVAVDFSQCILPVTVAVAMVAATAIASTAAAAAAASGNGSRGHAVAGGAFLGAQLQASCIAGSWSVQDLEAWLRECHCEVGAWAPYF